MAVIVNNPPYTREDRSSAIGTILGIILLLAIVFALFYYGLPALRGAFTAPQITIPGTIDVNVNTPKNQ